MYNDLDRIDAEILIKTQDLICTSLPPGRWRLKILWTLAVVACCHIAYDLHQLMLISTKTVPEIIRKTNEGQPRARRLPVIDEHRVDEHLMTLENKWILVDALDMRCSKVNWKFVCQEAPSWFFLILVNKPRDANGCHAPQCLEVTRETLAYELTDLKLINLNQSEQFLMSFKTLSLRPHALLEVNCNLLLNDHVNQTLKYFSVVENCQQDLMVNDIGIFDKPRPSVDSKTKEVKPKEPSSILNNKYVIDMKTDKCANIQYGYFHLLGEVGKENEICTNAPQFFSTRFGAKAFVLVNTTLTSFDKHAILLSFSLPGIDRIDNIVFRSVFIYTFKRNFDIDLSVHYFHSKPKINFLENQNVHYNISSLISCAETLNCKGMVNEGDCAISLFQQVLACLQTQSSNYKDVKKLTLYFQMWLTNIEKNGFKLPYLNTNKLNYRNPGIRVKYGFYNQNMSLLTSRQSAMIRKTVFQPYIQTICPNTTLPIPKSPSAWLKPVIEDIMLVVILNYETLFKVIPMVEYIHRPSFKYIAYCGPELDKFIEFTDSLGLTYLTYIEAINVTWHHIYTCVGNAMKLGVNVRGYLHIGDDVLVNTWNIHALDRDRAWMPGGYTQINLNKKEDGWYHWQKPWGRTAVMNVFQDLRNLSMLSSEETAVNSTKKRLSKFAKFFLNNYNYNMKSNLILKRAIDFFYMPSVFKDYYLLAMQLFLKHDCIVELAVPTIHLGLTHRTKTVYCESVSLWGEDRNNPWDKYSPKGLVFLHPFKTSGHFEVAKGRQFFCDMYMKHYTDFLYYRF